MKKRDVRLGETYSVKVSDRIVPVRLDREYTYGNGGWYGTNLLTNRQVVIRSAQRLRARLDACRHCPAWGVDLSTHMARRHPEEIR